MEQIIDDVFADFIPDKAVYYVHTCLYLIRKSLKDCGLAQAIKIDYRNKRYETSVADDLWIDYEQFLHAEEAQVRTELYAGDLLPEVEAEWKYPFQKTCDDLYVLALTKAIEHAGASGNVSLEQQYRERLRAFLE